MIIFQAFSGKQILARFPTIHKRRFINYAQVRGSFLNNAVT